MAVVVRLRQRNRQRRKKHLFLMVRSSVWLWLQVLMRLQVVQLKMIHFLVLFETVGKLDMPNSYKMNIKGCRFLGYAWGSLSTERVNARIESGSSCIVNGKTVKINVKGNLIFRRW